MSVFPKSSPLCASAAGLAIGVCATGWALPSYAFESLFQLLDHRESFAAQIPDGESHAEVADGFLLGTGVERIRHLPDGTLRIDRSRTYTRIRHPDDSHRFATLPEPWFAQATLIVQPNLRLVRADTRFQFKRSGDAIFPGYKLSEHEGWLFDHDHSVLRTSPDGTRMTHQEFDHGKVEANETYDYPSKSVPLELIGLQLSAAVARKLDQFDFELLVPGGSSHGVRATVHRTRDVRAFAKGYPIAPRHLTSPEMLAVIDLRLSSPVKYLFFPHHFYFAYSVAEPWKLMMLWGGDPDKNLQAFRTD
ncbi:MAG TPA: hypothetical protein VHZ95_21630 [Polyangiales bacterium]|nr:hypothetical protein [Polyangiales bacterium]